MGVYVDSRGGLGLFFARSGRSWRGRDIVLLQALRRCWEMHFDWVVGVDGQLEGCAKRIVGVDSDLGKDGHNAIDFFLSLILHFPKSATQTAEIRSQTVTERCPAIKRLLRLRLRLPAAVAETEGGRSWV